MLQKYFRPTKTSTDVTPNKDSVIKVKSAKKYKFRESHPGCNFSYLTKLKHPTIPRISLPHGGQDDLILSAKLIRLAPETSSF